MDKRKKMLVTVLGAMAVIMVSIVVYYVYNNTYYISTEDAHVSGDIARVNAQISGKLVELDVAEGDTVYKDQIIGRLESPSQTDEGIEQTLLRAPIDGIVIKKQGVPGEIISNGQAMAMVVDPTELYLTANIKETDLKRITLGQTVDVTLDQFGKQKWNGTVSLIGQASNSTFALISTSGGSTFTKVVQNVPIHITVDTQGAQLVQGTNAEVRIHVR